MEQSQSDGTAVPMMTQIAEKVLTLKCRLGKGMVSYCPTMDLVAVTTEDEAVHVFRFNGQKVFGGEFGKDKVRGLAWRADGQLVMNFRFPPLTLIEYRADASCCSWRRDVEIDFGVQREDSARAPDE